MNLNELLLSINVAYHWLMWLHCFVKTVTSYSGHAIFPSTKDKYDVELRYFARFSTRFRQKWGFIALKIWRLSIIIYLCSNYLRMQLFRACLFGTFFWKIWLLHWIIEKSIYLQSSRQDKNMRFGCNPTILFYYL